MRAGERVIPIEEVQAVRKALREAGRPVVFTNGCFDLLHVGHVRYLEEASGLGAALWVGLNSDASVRALKGPSRPVNGQAARAEVLAALRCVEYVTIFDAPRATGLIELLAPEVYVKGGDYTPETLNAEERAALEAAGARIEILPFVAGYSTTATLDRLQEPFPQS